MSNLASPEFFSFRFLVSAEIFKVFLLGGSFVGFLEFGGWSRALVI